MTSTRLCTTLLFLATSASALAEPTGTSTAGAAAKPRTTATIKVTVSTFESNTGFLGCRLFSVPATFPDSEGDGLRQPITGTTQTCTFEDVAPGTYAVAVMHDQNGNRKLDTNLFGVPTEGYGVSNNKTYALSSPKWDESKFVVSAGETRNLAVTLRY